MCSTRCVHTRTARSRAAPSPPLREGRQGRVRPSREPGGPGRQPTGPGRRPERSGHDGGLFRGRLPLRGRTPGEQPVRAERAGAGEDQPPCTATALTIDQMVGAPCYVQPSRLLTVHRVRSAPPGSQQVREEPVAGAPQIRFRKPGFYEGGHPERGVPAVEVVPVGGARQWKRTVCLIMPSRPTEANAAPTGPHRPRWSPNPLISVSVRTPPPGRARRPDGPAPVAAGPNVPAWSAS
ncbi:hypothetical protein RKD18_002874 [Streptomyces phaeoluteigriseus]